MNKGIIIGIGVALVIGLAGGAYWLVTQPKIPPQIPPTLTPSPSPLPTKAASPTPLPKNGTIEGSLSYPSEFIPEEMEVCAENQSTKEVHCTSKHIQNPKYTYGVGYMLEVPAGTYLVYASLPGDDYQAHYSEFVTCGLSVDCPSHEPIPVEVEVGETVSNIDAVDWYK